MIKLPKLKWVKIKGYRNKKSINGRIRSAVIRKDAERYYVSVLVEEDVYKPPEDGRESVILFVLKGFK